MKRTKKPTKYSPTIIQGRYAIFVGDAHFRDTIPGSREEQEFTIAQLRKLKFLKTLQKKYNASVIFPGDVFHHWKPSPALLSTTIENQPERSFCVFGNHDLPGHSLDLQYKCGLNVLHKAGKITILPGTHWEQRVKGPSCILQHLDKKRKILVWHVMTYRGKKPYPGCTDVPASGMLRKYSDYDVILTGHNHQQFTAQYENRWLINPGAFTRQSMSEVDVSPAVYLYDVLQNTVERIELPFIQNVLQKNTSVEKSEARDERISAFIEKLNTDFDSTLSFEKNIELFMEQNEITPEVKQIIRDEFS